MSDRGEIVPRLRVFGVRAAIWLPTAVALLSVVTGIVNIGATNVSGPLAPYIPASIERTAGFTGAFTGFLMLAAVYGLRRRRRVAWFMTVLLLPVTALQGLAQSSAYSYPLVALSVLSLPTVLVNYRVFDRELSFSTTQFAALAAIVGAQAYGTIGTYVLRDDFANVQTALDAFYYTLVTASTVGYGDAAPTTQTARLFGMSVIVIGTASFAAALGTLIGPAIEARLATALGTMSDSQLELLEDHVIVVGMGDTTVPIIEELTEKHTPFVVVTRDPEKAQRLRERGVEVLTADPSDEEPLLRVGIERARALVAATNDDAQDAMAVLTARELNNDLVIVAAATERENEKKLRRAGADTVISPAVIGGHLLVQSAMGNREMEEVADRVAKAESEEDLAPEHED
ncbi:NAD-binding protein [Halorarius litoreus]|uniref:NAD-binding protein n=1 Tax=Halorarius litoreus TaxID=2962676 RepID=UPI0020CDBBDB|nr:NAD-binding protein [Halorarius litoreus]